jgi:hypothetical protein
MLVEASGFQPIEKSLYYGGELNGVKEVVEEVTLERGR